MHQLSLSRNQTHQLEFKLKSFKNQSWISNLWRWGNWWWMANRAESWSDQRRFDAEIGWRGGHWGRRGCCGRRCLGLLFIVNFLFGAEDERVERFSRRESGQIESLVDAIAKVVSHLRRMLLRLLARWNWEIRNKIISHHYQSSSSSSSSSSSWSASKTEVNSRQQSRIYGAPICPNISNQTGDTSAIYRRNDIISIAGIVESTQSVSVPLIASIHPSMEHWIRWSTRSSSNVSHIVVFPAIEILWVTARGRGWARERKVYQPGRDLHVSSRRRADGRRPRTRRRSRSWSSTDAPTTVIVSPTPHPTFLSVQLAIEINWFNYLGGRRGRGEEEFSEMGVHSNTRSKRPRQLVLFALQISDSNEICQSVGDKS